MLGSALSVLQCRWLLLCWVASCAFKKTYSDVGGGGSAPGLLFGAVVSHQVAWGRGSCGCMVCWSRSSGSCV